MKLQVAVEVLVSLAIASLLVSYAVAADAGAVSSLGHSISSMRNASCRSMETASRALASCSYCIPNPTEAC